MNMHMFKFIKIYFLIFLENKYIYKIINKCFLIIFFIKDY